MHDLVPLPLVAASLALIAFPAAAPARVAIDRARSEIAELRARGPAALEELLSEYDRAAPSARDALAARIDAVAGQRHATVSRLYWYTDLDRARQAARQLHRPILALRMLGDLRDDLSCANSRLFRATLYANAEVSAFLRSHFVLYWSSERTVPTVTIDFGGGRKIVGTTTGNSAHYVLDETGQVLDVLPGLYAPRVFQRELTTSLALANKVRGLPDADRDRATVAHHAAALDATERARRRLTDTAYIEGGRFLMSGDPRSIAIAQAATATKASIEVPQLQRIGMIGPGEVPRDEAAWSALAQQMWNIGVPEASGPPPRRGQRVPPSVLLDAQSRELVARLHNAGPTDQRATAAELATVIARLEHHIAADTALNELMLRQQIRFQIANHAATDFATLNAWIYESVFATPKSDPWLGLRPRTDFTGLPGDGVVTR
jgi:hypothetical protein